MFVAPQVIAAVPIPKQAAIDAANAPALPDIASDGGVVGGMPGGVLGGVLGGSLGGSIGAPPAPKVQAAPAPAPVAKTPSQIRVGGEVQAARLPA